MNQLYASEVNTGFDKLYDALNRLSKTAGDGAPATPPLAFSAGQIAKSIDLVNNLSDAMTRINSYCDARDAASAPPTVEPDPSWAAGP